MATIGKSNIIFGVVLGLLVLGGLAAYFFNGQVADAAEPQGGAPQMQAMPVPAVRAEKKDVQIWKDFSGRMVAVDEVELRPQVSGTITEIKFKDGERVEKDDVLFVIDPKPYEATVAQAEALVAAAKNQKSFASKELKRAKELVETKAISERVLSERNNTYLRADAELKGAEAALVSAKIDLDYAHVKAPISGRVGRVEVTLGNLVDAGPNAPLLTTIVSDDGIYADFEVDEQTYVDFVRASAKDRMAENKMPVKVYPKSHSDMIYEGNIYSFDNQIDASSGTIRARALFKNEDHSLLPGMFVTVRLGGADAQEEVVVSSRAVGTDQNRKFVYVVNDQGVLEYREVELGVAVNGSRIIRSGLNAGEVIVREGLVRMRPGMPVAPQFGEEVNQGGPQGQAH